jgi:hypothetical protein
LEDKLAANRDPLPPGLIRLAAVLAEIALNGTDSSLDLESPSQEKVDGLDENPLRLIINVKSCIQSILSYKCFIE